MVAAFPRTVWPKKPVSVTHIMGSEFLRSSSMLSHSVMSDSLQPHGL